MDITGKHLTALGYKPGAWFKTALEQINAQGLTSDEAIRAVCDALVPVYMPLESSPVTVYSTETGSNFDASYASMLEMAKTPTISAAYLMPDACPTGGLGTITVGGVARARGAIHPGMHSADICCSMMVTRFGSADPGDVLDTIHEATHFGYGGRKDGRFPLPDDLRRAMADNPFLSDPQILDAAQHHLGTQGDGNHFAFVGVSQNTGEAALVTHHGSRKPGALLYKAGMKVAEQFRTKLSPDTLKQNAWIPFDSPQGQDYWNALQIIRDWTKHNHRVLHQVLVDRFGCSDRLWNEHNFVFRDGDDFWHAKGATPMNPKFMPDSDGLMAIPMNMGQPVLIVSRAGCDFAPHGAGRMTSRTAHLRALDMTVDQAVRVETEGLDVRFYCGEADASELPSAYKDAARVQADMQHFDLARVQDRIMPYGCIMAGDVDKHAPWRRKKA
ncbi:MAG: RtcB family protein [Paracoccus sp. (in: a-proteobacteria)]|uniref:RtcB family protein n=1 Tax=Paracoccus sp. TaxID=267 RepID=UPI0026DF308E|nr:RtcB family protein [Paracoccus sp. (in: a-proteobacteria)]MDO5613535.1 RtcB family protein [Paracoccus sp. (in: a-proteobacteria)]